MAGVDEVGRGALFGPVAAAAIAVPLAVIPKLLTLGIKDSKQLSPKRRQALVPLIKQHAIAWHISYATVEEIATINIRQASLLAMKRCLLKLAVSPHHCLIDGRDLIPDLGLTQTPMIKGDQRSPVIAAASILAKVWRDDLITRIAPRYPVYDLATNKGYGTQKHRLALQQYGLTPLHRAGFCRKIMANSDRI
ncbi:MAG: ribonuclease HII [Snowella sp.]|nr:ribonuclease HII [Snowella sp.]